MNSLVESDRIFSTREQMSDVRNLYSKLRGGGAHSIDVASHDQWTAYSRCCEDLLARLARILLGDSSDLELPNLMSQLTQSVLADGKVGFR